MKDDSHLCPFLSKPFHHENRIERICTEALEAHGLMPDEPAAIRIDRFIEKQFKLSIEYADLQERFGEGVMGACKFGRDGEVTRILVDLTLAEDDSRIAEKRVRSTLAHEGGHGLFHGPLFAEMFEAEEAAGKLVQVDRSAGITADGFACRRIGEGGGGKRYDWWEVQANRAMASLLLPRRLVDPFVRANIYMPVPKFPGMKHRPMWDLREVAGMVADQFEVSISMATYRIQDLHESLTTQPTLL